MGAEKTDPNAGQEDLFGQTPPTLDEMRVDIAARVSAGVKATGSKRGPDNVSQAHIDLGYRSGPMTTDELASARYAGRRAAGHEDPVNPFPSSPLSAESLVAGDPSQNADYQAAKAELAKVHPLETQRIIDQAVSHGAAQREAADPQFGRAADVFVAAARARLDQVTDLTDERKSA